MKKIFITVVTLILSISLITGCGGSTVKAYSNPEETIDSSMNKEFIVLIALESNPTTGYSWEAEYDAAILELVEDTFEPGEYAEQGLVGAGGTQLFRFKGLSSGKTDITFKYKRSWETETLDTKVFTVEVK
ncbi:protease inhibitor I42 family protein [Chloroflexota bacterium]